MSYMAIASGLTIDDFERLPLALVKNKELVNGELVDVSGNKGKHHRLRDRLIVLLLDLVEGQKKGLVVSEQEFEFEDNAHAPDVAVIDASKVALFDGDRRVQRFVPDLAIEIVSDSDRFTYLMEKAERYIRCGTSEVWILARETRLALRLTKHERVMLTENDRFQSELIPGFSIRLGELFDRA
jgi:Uma2 family endonuclease